MDEAPDFERLGRMLGEVMGAPAPEGAGAPRAASSAGPGGAGPGGARPAGPQQDLGRLLAVVWPDVVGPEVAANTRPVQLRQGRLVVSASSSAWAQTLQLMSEAIVDRLNERLGPGSVERAVFRHAGWVEYPRSLPARPAAPGVPSPGVPSPVSAMSSAAPPPSLSREQEEALAVVERLDLAPELREKITRAMRAAFVRAQQDSVR